ncbi:hypothetical protein FIBSPDRAFT_970603 [Athelia psychrophila]|uniref:Uncharacterized protein n=1 Tax=Athelia psychrophila TaxID=1759441 RepID=A0A167SLJ6_9AGAM|nr:hypothetical protein FIBSPDRAFT_970603 [Fibularhizoctonia sp. CBS 109695]
MFNFNISLSLIFNQYVNPVALDALGWKYYVSDANAAYHASGSPTLWQLVYVAWLAVESVFVLLFIIETKNKNLEETAAQESGCIDTAQMDENIFLSACSSETALSQTDENDARAVDLGSDEKETLVRDDGISR